MVKGLALCFAAIGCVACTQLPTQTSDHFDVVELTIDQAHEAFRLNKKNWNKLVSGKF